jgi:thiol-disulfide isomerase/thioredoxin
MSDNDGGTDHTGGAATMSARSGTGLLRSLAHRLTDDADALPVEGHLPSFDGATGWLNSDGVTPEGLRGRVVLIDFWTYTCINWLRTAPYVRAWDAKYRDKGLTVIGVHTPEFGFERNLENVVAQSRRFGVEYPVAIDSDYGVWQAFANHFWPALYIADAEGRIRYHHFGEGEYAMAEMVVQQLLLEAGAVGVDPDLVSVEPTGFEVPRRLAHPAIARDVPRLRPECRVRVARTRQVQRAAHLSRAFAARPQRVGAVRNVDARAARRRPERRSGPHRVPVPSPRCQPRDGTGSAGRVRAVPADP